VRPHRVEAVRVRYPVVRVELAEQGEPGLRAVHHGQGDRAAEGDHRSGRHLGEHFVQREDLRPVRHAGGRGLIVHRGDRRLPLVRTGIGSAVTIVGPISVPGRWPSQGNRYHLGGQYVPKSWP